MFLFRIRPLFLTIAILSFTSTAYADPTADTLSDCELSGCFVADPPTEAHEDPEPQWLQVGIAPALELGRGVVGAAVVSPFLTIRTWQGLRLGVAYTPDVGITDGMEGCSTVTICNNARSRVSGRAEYQFGTLGFRPWLALELGRERWSGTDMTTGGFPEVSGVRTVWAGQAGFDGVVGRKGGSIGLGLFATYIGQHDGGGIGAGARLVMGFL